MLSRRCSSYLLSSPKLCSKLVATAIHRRKSCSFPQRLLPKALSISSHSERIALYLRASSPNFHRVRNKTTATTSSLPSSTKTSPSESSEKKTKPTRPASDVLPSGGNHGYFSYRDKKGRGFRVHLEKSLQIVGIRSTRGSTDNQNEDRYRSATVRLQSCKDGEFRQWLYFGVFDGHGGSRASDFASAKLHHFVENCKADDYGAAKSYFKNLGGEWQNFSPAALAKIEKKVPSSTFAAPKASDGTERERRKSAEMLSTLMTIEERLTLAFLRADQTFLELPRSRGNGSTSSVVVARGENDDPIWACENLILYVAHVGDTRAILCNADGRAVPLTRNHHANLPDERDRLKRYGENIVRDSYGDERVAGLANTRALGDYQGKLSGVTSEPEITKFEGDATRLGFFVIVSDGVSGVMTDQEIVDVVKLCRDPTSAAMRLVEVADQLGSEDNQTVMVVRLPGWGSATQDYTREVRNFRLHKNSKRSRGGSGTGGPSSNSSSSSSSPVDAGYSYEGGTSDVEREALLAKLYHLEPKKDEALSSNLTSAKDNEDSRKREQSLAEEELKRRLSEQEVELIIDTGILSMQDASQKESPKSDVDDDPVPLFFSVLGKKGKRTETSETPPSSASQPDLSSSSVGMTMDELRKAWSLLGVRIRKTGAAKLAEEREQETSKRGVVKGPPGVKEGT